MPDKKDETPNSEFARMKERSLDGSTLKANADKASTYRLTVRKTHEPKTTRDGNPYISASAIYSRFVGEAEERRTWVLITAFGATAAKALLQLEPGDQGEFTGRLTSKMGEYEIGRASCRERV